MEADPPRSHWTFVTHHARILAMLSRDPELRMRDMAEACQITERAVSAVVTDLEAGGYLTRVRHGRRNHYRIAAGTLFRHPAEGPHEIAHLIKLLAGLEPGGRVAARPPGADNSPDSDGTGAARP